jgi:ABC-type transporter Mla maintaining outer membrane lipid asymmetry permease subunit MlaE
MGGLVIRKEVLMSLKVTIALFIAYCVASTVYAVSAYVFVSYLNPTLPVIPGCMGFVALVFAGLAGKTWADIDLYDCEEEA